MPARGEVEIIEISSIIRDWKVRRGEDNDLSQTRNSVLSRYCANPRDKREAGLFMQVARVARDSRLTP